MERIQDDFKLKDDKIDPPDIYLVASLANIKLESGNYCCTMLPGKYLKATVKNLE